METDTKQSSSYRRLLAAVAVVAVFGTSVSLYFHNRPTGHATVLLSNQALVGKWSGVVALPVGRLGQRHHANLPVDLTFQSDGTVVSRFGGDTKADYAVQGKFITYNHVRYQGRNLAQPMEQQASLTGDTLILTNRDKSTMFLRRD